jgi:hypothetical protein
MATTNRRQRRSIRAFQRDRAGKGGSDYYGRQRRKPRTKNVDIEREQQTATNPRGAGKNRIEEARRVMGKQQREAAHHFSTDMKRGGKRAGPRKNKRSSARRSSTRTGRRT